MINSVEDLRSAGTLPTGPVSAWPKERNVASPEAAANGLSMPVAKPHATKVTASFGDMAKGALQNTVRAVKHGKVPADIRNARYATCKACPMFIESSKRCSDCGCFMEAKTWLNYPPSKLCPQKKWKR